MITQLEQGNKMINMTLHLDLKEGIELDKELAERGFRLIGNRWYTKNSCIEPAITPYMYPDGVPKFAEYTYDGPNPKDVSDMFVIKSYA